MRSVRGVLVSGSSMVRTLDGILKENQQEIGRLLRNVDKLTLEAQGLLASVHHGVGDSRSIERTLANVEALSGSIRRDIDPLLEKTKKALDGVTDLTGMVGPAEKKKLVAALDGLNEIESKVSGIASDAQAMVKDVRRGKGTAGALLVEPQIYDDLKELVRDLKRNPWKFFWKE
jgi:phospholipid/cholesterol/gamma-HCH transport system substrate-binding protein